MISMIPSLYDTVCDEKQLLLCCGRVRMQPAIAERIRYLASRPLDWDYLFSEAAENSLIPLLYLQLNGFAAEQVPAQQMDRLNMAARANTVRSLFLTAELIRVMDALVSRGVRAIPYKGPTLAAQAYGDVTLRQFGDLDIILRHADLPKAHEAMLGLGYRPKFAWILSPDVAASLVPVEYSYRDEARQTLVELQTERSLRHFPAPSNLDELTQQLVSVSLSGHEIRTFSPEDSLAILCVHGSKDFWERLSWIVDISEMVQSHESLDWVEVFRSAESFRARRMLCVGLALAADLFDTALPVEIATRVKSDHVAAELAAQIEQRLLSRELPPLSVSGRFRFRRRMVPGAFDGWRYALRLATVPAEEDWEMVRLPGPLALLYIALRPLRLLRKYGGKR
jgi:hypothetical protein